MSLAIRSRARAKRFSDSVVRRIFARASSRRFLNMLYRRLPDGAKQFSHLHFAKIFRSAAAPIEPGVWVVDFGNAEIQLPVTADRAWLDWDEALSLLGHESWIKETYRTFLTSPNRPALFADIGANYGTHSLLFLSHHVEVISFEPNLSCQSYFREACALNGFTPTLHQIALGKQRTRTELLYPEKETWLGSTDAAAVESMRHQSGIVRQPVDVVPLDEFENLFAGKRALVKIDAEGYELEILGGAERVLRQHRPVILFEAPRERGISPVVAFLRARRYRLAELPIIAQHPLRVLADADLPNYTRDDLIAVPDEYCTPAVLADAAKLFAI